MGRLCSQKPPQSQMTARVDLRMAVMTRPRTSTFLSGGKKNAYSDRHNNQYYSCRLQHEEGYIKRTTCLFISRVVYVLRDMYQILGTLANQENNRLMQTAAAAALGDCLDHVDGRPFGLRSEATVPNLLPEPKVITLELFDGQWRQLSDPQRLDCVRAKRAVVELTARFASSSFLQWSAHNESFWRDTLLARLRDQARQHEVLLYSDQVWLIEQNVLPKLCISLRLQDLCAEDMKWYLEFIKLSSAELFSEEQLTLLKRVEATNRKRITQQVIVEVELQFKFCKLNAEHLYALTNALEQADHVQSSEPTKYPVKYDVTSLWIGGNQLKDMSDLQSLTELVVSPFTRIGHLNFHWAFGDRMSMDAYCALKRLILRTLRDPHSTLRHLDLSYTPTGNTILKNLFSALRESEQLHELSIDGLKTIPESSTGDFMNDRWAWIAFGLLHEDSCSQVHHEYHGNARVSRERGSRSSNPGFSAPRQRAAFDH